MKKIRDSINGISDDVRGIIWSVILFISRKIPYLLRLQILMTFEGLEGITESLNKLGIGKVPSSYFIAENFLVRQKRHVC
jgi:hypothetical protein